MFKRLDFTMALKPSCSHAYSFGGGGKTLYSCAFWEVVMNKLKVCDLVSWRAPIRHHIDLAQESSSQITFTPVRCKGHYASLVTSSTSSEVRYKTHHASLVTSSTSSEVRCKGHHDNLIVTPTSSEVRCKGHHDNLVVTPTSSEVKCKTHHDNLVVTPTSSEERCKK